MTVMAWWYGPDTLPHCDDRPVAVGTTHAVEGEIGLCENGLHGSVLPLDALNYGSGHFWRVKHTGVVVYGDDKLCSSERTYTRKVANTDAVLRHFAWLCALDVVHLWGPPEAVLRYLKTGDEGLRAAARAAARGSAWDAARASACDAAWDAARASACDAASYAAWDAARAAACYTASYAARDAATASAREKQNKRLHRMLMAASALQEVEGD